MALQARLFPNRDPSSLHNSIGRTSVSRTPISGDGVLGIALGSVALNIVAAPPASASAPTDVAFTVILGRGIKFSVMLGEGSYPQRLPKGVFRHADQG